MFRIMLKIDGMACGMCEAHVNDAIRKSFAVKKVTSSHKKGRTEILSETPIEEAQLRTVIEETGYSVIDVKTESCEKKEISLFHKNSRKG